MTLPLTMPAHRAYPAVSFAQLQRELADEARRRRETYPGMIAKGRMTPEEADYQHQVLAAIAADLEGVIAFPSSRPETGGMETPQGSNISPVDPLPTLSWAEKRNALTRELTYRARLYPVWIAKGTLTEAEAAHRTACLEAMLALYNEGLAWRSSTGHRTHFGTDPASPEIRQAREEWAETQAALAGQAQTAQKELSL